MEAQNILRVMAHALLPSLLVAVCATGDTSEHKRGMFSQSDAWPENLVDIVDQDPFLSGYNANFNDWFYFEGGVETLNQFVNDLGELPGTLLELVIHEGETDEVRANGKATDRSPDWSLFATSLLSKEQESIMNHPILIAKTNTNRHRNKPIFLRLDIYLNGANEIALDKLDIPLAIDVETGALSVNSPRNIAKHNKPRPSSR